MISHNGTIDSDQIPSQNKTKSKLQILKICQKFKYKVDTILYHRWTEEQMDKWKRWNELHPTPTPPNQGWGESTKPEYEYFIKHQYEYCKNVWAGIARLCAFSLLAHSNSKRHIKLSLFLFFT